MTTLFSLTNHIHATSHVSLTADVENAIVLDNTSAMCGLEELSIVWVQCLHKIPPMGGDQLSKILRFMLYDNALRLYFAHPQLLTVLHQQHQYPPQQQPLLVNVWTGSTANATEPVCALTLNIVLGWSEIVPSSVVFVMYVPTRMSATNRVRRGKMAATWTVLA
ncbi:hypothetical protein PoB_005026900 [Plakobranchus ocellatus]|uniref:Uncharacterized protein n=1 Tax=Plakobranchus ocellatus TaxID=259542 RepID=A0AAV4BUA1_9GAST|nr:hypothetical protein PoB_005026900 [Plakobranchus ocellatus]